jgi:hypothetical protein
MDARWMPLLAAALGVVGGVGGAYIGGVVANEGQERTSEKERAAALQELRRDTYGDFLGTVQELQVGATARDEGGRTKREQDELNEIAVRLFVAKARVDLVSDSGSVEKAAAEVLDASTDPTPMDDPTTRKFRVAAQNDIEAAGK